MKNIIERIAGGAKIARYLPKAVSTRLAVAALAVIAAGGAGAATVTTVGGVGDDVTVQNVTGNAGGYVWNTTTMTLTLPAKENLPRGSAVEIVSVEMVEVGTSTQNSIAYGIPATLTIGSATATLDNSETYDGTLFGAVNNAKLAKYEFAEGNRPVFMVGLPSAVSMTFSGNSTRLRALPTNSNGDSTDLVVGVGNTQYQPCIRITGKIVSTSVYTATTEATSANFSELTWSPSISGVDTSSASLVINAPNLATLTIDETRTAGSLFVDSAASTLTVNQSGENILTAKGLGVASSIWFKIAGTAPLTIMDGGIKGASEIYVTAGSTLNLSNVASPAKINAYGTVKTAGTDVTLLSNSDNRFQNTSHLNVTAGNTFVSSPSGGNNGISKQITIASGAKLSAVSSDGLAYNKSVVIDVYGTLEFYNGCYWSTGNSTINLYEGAVVSGSQTGNRGTLDFNNTSSAKINVYGDAEITAAVRPNYSSVGVNVAEGKTLSISVAPIIGSGGSFAKTGAGTLQFKNIAAIPVTGSEGCVELLNNSGSAISYTNTLGFSGTLKTTRNGSGHIVIGSGDEDTTQGNILLTGSPTLEIGGTNPYLCLAKQVAGNWLAIKNLTASSSSTVIDPVYGGADTDTYIVKTLKNLQTENTTFAGTFNGSSASGRRVDLEVYGQNETVRSLTLSGNNTKSCGTLTIRDYAKVIFEGSGNWAQGSVVVNEHGYIESKNSNGVASTLTLGNGATIVVSSVNDAAVALCGTTVTLPDGGTVYVDLSGVVADPGDVVTILSATTLNNGDTATFEATSGSWRFATSGTTVTATKLGTLTWDGTNWSDSNFTGYTAATIAVSGSQTVTLPDSGSLDTLTLSGSGEVAFAPTTAETLSATTIMIGNGVTLDASDALALTGVTINNEGTSGTGSFKIPEGITCTMEDVTCTARIYCYGNLVTREDTDLSCASTGAGSWSYFYSGSKLTVATGETKIRSESQGLKGNIEIASGATLTENRGYDDGLDFNSTLTIDVRGTLAMGSVRWTVGANNTINIYEGAMVTGSVAGNGNLDWKDTGSVVNVYGDADVDANLRFRSGCNVAVNVAEGKTLTIKKPFATSTALGTLTKSGDGTLRLEDVMCTSAGQTTEPTIAGSEGTVEFFSKTNHRYMNKPVTFSGKVKFTQDSTNSKELIVNSTTLFANRPSLEVSGGFTMHSNLAADNVALEVSNLSGSGTISPKFGEQATARIVDTKQTTETVFRGVFSHHQSQGDRKTGLVVRGDGTTTVHSLTLTAENGTTGPLTVLNYGKVIFGENASWGNGTVTVGANGYLESVNAAAVAKLTLQDGAHIVFPAATSSLGGISELAFATGTTYISFPDGVTPTDGATLIDWSAANLEAAPAGEFALADSTLAGEWILTKSADGLSIAAAGAQIVYSNGDVVPCAAVDESTLAAFMTAIGTDEGATLRILGNTSIGDDTISGLAVYNIYYDNTTKTFSKAVAMVGTAAAYPSLASAVAAASDGDSVYLLRASAETVTINAKAITLVQTAAFSGTLSGNGTITLQTLSTSLHFDSWTGTVVLPQVNGTADGFRFDYYGKSGSTIAITKGFSGWINTSTADAYQIKAGIWIDNDSQVTINGTNSGTWYQIAKLSGGGNFSLIQSNAPAGFHILVLEDYSGTLSNTIGSGTPTALTVSRLNLAAAPVAGQRLINTTTPNAVNLESVYVGDAQQSVSLAKGVDGIYAALVSVTKGSSPATYYATVSDAMTAAGSDAATITLLGNTDSNVSLAVGQSLVTDGFSVGTVSTGAEHCHVVDNAGVYTVALDQFAVTIPSVANTTVSVSYTSGSEALVATAAGDIMVDYGTDVTAAWTAVSGYKITSGASQTLNAVTSAQTLASPTVEAMGATVSDVSVSYGADYASATVTATVSDTTLDYYISWGNGEPVKGTTGSGSTVTFDVSGIAHSAPYQSSGYNISAKDGETTVTTTGGSGESVAADVAANWINENATTHGNAVAAGGVWTNAEAVTYSDGKAAITDNRFAATTASTSSRVVLEFKVCFSSVSDADVDGDAQGALKLGEVNSVTTFMVLTNGNQWAAVSNVGLTPDPTATNTVVMTFDYANNTYSVSVDNYELTDGSGSSSFPLAASRTGVKDIDFAGTGTLVSMKGDQVEGYMVVDKNGMRYPTIAAAIAAYNADPTIGPLKLLHAGTAPSGWRIDGDTLIKAAKGLFFMAF